MIKEKMSVSVKFDIWMGKEEIDELKGYMKLFLKMNVAEYMSEKPSNVKIEIEDVKEVKSK